MHPFHTAVAEGDIATVRRFLAEGIEVDLCANNNGDCPFCATSTVFPAAALSQKSAESFITDEEVVPFMAGRVCMTALHLAVADSNVAMARLLLEHGALIGSVATEAVEAEMEATEEVEVGTEGAEDSDSDMAREKAKESAASPSTNPLSFRLVHWTPLLTAAQNGNVELAALLVNEAGSCEDNHVENSNGKMWFADQKSCINNSSGLRLNFQDGDGFTALHWAALAGSAPLTALLLRAGARTDIRANNGKRAARYARGAVLRLLNPSRVDDECWQNR